MNKTNTAAAAAAATVFAAGDRVTVCTAATGGEPLAGTIETISKGWYVVELDEEIKNAKGQMSTTVSARASSLQPLDVEPVADLGSQERSALRAMARTECPECGSGELESERLANGKTRTTCNACDWTSDDEEDEAEEALEEAETVASRMAEALRRARVRYTKARRPSGTATAHNGDTIARELLDYEPLEVAEIADRCLKLPKGTHAARYANLNSGQIRMNSGNRIRGAWKRAERDGDTDTIAHILFVLGLDDQLAEEAA